MKGTSSWFILAVATVGLISESSQQVSLQPARVKQKVAASGERDKSRVQGDVLQQQQQKHQQTASSYNRLFAGYRAVARASVASGLEQIIGSDEGFVCAAYCSCSTVQVADRILGSASSRMGSSERSSNLSRVYCESIQFTDLLTIDRRTQIIHISLPSNQSSTGPEDSQEADNQQQQKQLFRMPRLAQFGRLREIIIIKLKFEVCDSEVFKRGQKLLRFRLNHNHLNRISKSCLKHLDKLLELNLDHNHLSELESALFSGLNSLRSLSIAHNRLSELAAHQFVNLSRLSTLNLVGNSFKTINLHLLEPMQSSLRFLFLAKNQIRSFIYSPQRPPDLITTATAAAAASTIRLGQQQSTNSNNNNNSMMLVGLVFKNLIKLNVDENKFERIKLLQLHRFYNVKYLSIRQNEIATIRDKAFNGLKLVELNLAHNQLQTISKCAFCNSTIRRLVLSNNNISLPEPSGVLQLQNPSRLPLVASSGATTSMAAAVASPLSAAAEDSPTIQQLPTATSSQNMLILSQSIFGPLFGQLEYLDLSNNPQLASQLEFLIEPLLKLEYLNLASVGLDRSLPSPSLFKNLRQLRYLNLSHNQLDQLIAETIEPLSLLEILDLSHNKFSELDESFLVTVDEMSPLKLLNLGSNPWYCSQCKVAPLYDWILRSPIYNMTCISPLLTKQQLKDSDDSSSSSVGLRPADGNSDDDDARNHLVPLAENNYASIDDDKLVVEDVDLMNDEQQQLVNSNYNLLSASASSPLPESAAALPADPLLLVRELMQVREDDQSISQTMALVASVGAAGAAGDSQMRSINFDTSEYCLRCEFPSELSAFHIHELAPGDFKFCAGAAPRFAASEPKIGLTLAIVIIGALFCVIVVVILMYRKKSQTYYTNEDMDQLDGGGGGGGQTSGKKPVFSISSDNENNQYGDGTDYSSPPMSRSMDSYSQEDEDDDEALDEDEEDYEDEDEDEDEDEEDDYEGTLADEDEEEQPPAVAAPEPVSSVDPQQSRQAAEETKRHRQSQLDQYNKRNGPEPATSAVAAASTTHEPKSSSASPAAVASPESQANGPAKSAARADNSLAGAGRQATAKSMTGSYRQHSSVDSATIKGTKSEAVDSRRPNQHPHQHQSTTSILSRNQSHPQHQRLVFAEHSSLSSTSQGASPAQVRSHRNQKSRLRDGGQEQSATMAAAAPGLEPPEPAAGHRQPATTSRSAVQEERVPTMHQLASNHEPPKSRPQQIDAHKQHSLDKSARRKDHKQSAGPSMTERSMTLRSNNKEQQILNPSKLIQVPSQPSGGAGPQMLAQLQAQDLQPQAQPQLQHTGEHVSLGQSKDRARQRFATSKEISQTMGGNSAKPSPWSSGESHHSGGGGRELRRPRRGELLAGAKIGAASDLVGRQMANLRTERSPPQSEASDDATTADSLALEQPNVMMVSSLDDELDGQAESMNYSGGGGVLAVDSPDSLENVVSDDDDDDDDRPNRRLRPAVSSHSALTQTGSGDLLE